MRSELGCTPALYEKDGQPFITDQPGRRLSDWFYRLSPWAVAGLACIVAAIVWSAGSVALDTQIAHLGPLAPAKVSQP